MNICILSCFGDLLLKDSGPSVRIYQLAKSLAWLGHNVHVIIPSEKTTSKRVDGIVVHGINGACPKVILRFLSRLLGVARYTSFLFHDFLFISRAYPIILKSDIVQLEQQLGGGILISIIKRILKKPLILDCHDTFQSLRIKHTGTIRKILETFLEKTAYKCGDVILTVSQREKEILVSNGVRQREIKVIPNGVDTEAFNPSLDGKLVQKRYNLRDFFTIVFVGNMEYLPNREAVHVITSEIAPKIQKEIGNTKFLIVGRTPTKIESRPNLIFTGVVKNVAELLVSSDVAIAPLFHGSGTRLKILEYFSCGLPVVSTAVGVEGLEVKSGANVMIEDDMDQFSVKVTKLLKDKTLSKRLGRAARELVVNRYEWKEIARQLEEVHRGVLSGTIRC